MDLFLNLFNVCWIVNTGTRSLWCILLPQTLEGNLYKNINFLENFLGNVYKKNCKIRFAKYCLNTSSNPRHWDAWLPWVMVHFYFCQLKGLLGKSFQDTASPNGLNTIVMFVDFKLIDFNSTKCSTTGRDITLQVFVRMYITFLNRIS